MKKIDLKLVVTDENGKDNTLSLFVPIQNGEDYVSSIELLNTVGEFISMHLPNDNKNILSTNNILDYYIFKNKKDLNSRRKEVRTQKDMLNKNTSNFSRDSYFNYLQKEYGEEEIEQSDITINIIKLTISDVDRKLINEFKEPINPLRYDFIINKSCKELVLENRCAAENLELVNSVVREYIAINSGINELSKREMIENELHATAEDTIILNNYVNRKYICDSESITPRRYTRRHKDKQKEKNSKRKELFQKTSPFPIVVEDGFNKDKTSFIVAPSLSGVHSYMHLNDMPTTGEYSLYLSGVQFVSLETNKEIVFYKVTSVNNNISAYVDTDKDKLCSENLYISELSIIKIMERFDLSFSEFKDKVLTYDGEDYYIEEILEKEIANPELRSHQLDDIDKVDTIQPEEDVCLIIENEPISYVGLSKLSKICGEEDFPESLYPGMFVIIETAIFMLLKDGLKIEEMVSVTNWFPKESNKKLIVLASNFNALKEANEVLDLECKKIKIINTEDNQKQDIKEAEDDSKSSLKACEIKIKPDTKSVNFIELDIDDMVYFLKMSDVFEYTFTDSKLKMKDLLEKYKLEDLAYVIGYLPDDSTKKVIIEKSILPILEEVNKCLDLTAKKIKIKDE